VKPEELTLEDALGLLRLPRQLGEHPDGGRVEAGLGRFGPYVVHHKGKGEKDYRSLKAEDDVLLVGLSRALELLAMPKRGRGGRTALKDLGTPEGGDEAIQLFDGPYGLYVKQGKVNASLPEGTTADTITLEQAVELLAAKTASGSKTAGRRGGTAKKTTTKTPAARKPPATTKTGRLRASSVRVIKPAGG
jgi:DNA topoisomerase-1